MCVDTIHFVTFIYMCAYTIKFIVHTCVSLTFFLKRYETIMMERLLKSPSVILISNWSWPTAKVVLLLVCSSDNVTIYYLTIQLYFTIVISHYCCSIHIYHCDDYRHQNLHVNYKKNCMKTLREVCGLCVCKECPKSYKISR